MLDARKVLEMTGFDRCNLIFSFSPGSCGVLGEIVNTGESFIAERSPCASDRGKRKFLTEHFFGEEGYWDCVETLEQKGFKVWTPPNSDAIPWTGDRPQKIREANIASLQTFLEENYVPQH